MVREPGEDAETEKRVGFTREEGGQVGWSKTGRERGDGGFEPGLINDSGLGFEALALAV